jgi:hypothetical protein
MTQMASPPQQRHPVLRVDVKLSVQLADIVPTQQEIEVVREAVTRDLSELIATLGVPTALEVAIAPTVAPTTQTSVVDHIEAPDGCAFLRLQLDGVPCRFPVGLPHLLNAVRVREFPSDRMPGDLARLDWPAEGATVQDLADLVAMVCAEAVKITPSRLLSLDTSNAVAIHLQEAMPLLPLGVLDPDRLHSTLSAILNMGIAIHDHAKIGNLLSDGAELTPLEAQELLIAGLARETVDVLLADDVSATLAGELADGPTDLVSFITEGLFEETGLVFPRVLVLVDTALPSGTFSIRINDVSSPAFPLLTPEQCLVHDVVERVAPLVPDAKGVVNPATGQPATIVEATELSQLAALGLTTWNRQEYVALHVACVMRKLAARAVNQDRIGAQLEALEDALPVLVRAARAQLPHAEFTELIRKLVRGDVPLRHLPGLLERLVDLPTRTMGPDRYSLVDDPVQPPMDGLHSLPGLDQVEEFVRVGMRDQIAHKASRGTGVIVAYLLDADIETALRIQPRTEDDDERILSAILHELEFLPRSAAIPVIMTDQIVRAHLLALVSPSLPDVGVIGHGDVPPPTLVQPVARITFEDLGQGGER